MKVDGDKPTPLLPSNCGDNMGMPNSIAKIAEKNPSANSACTTMACLLGVIACLTGLYYDLTVGPSNNCRRSLKRCICA